MMEKMHNRGFGTLALLIALLLVSTLAGAGVVYLTQVPVTHIVIGNEPNAVTEVAAQIPEVLPEEVTTPASVVVIPTPAPTTTAKPTVKPVVADTPAPSAPTVSIPPASAVSGTGKSRIIFLHHSTGSYVYEKGTPEYLANYNSSHGTEYNITEKWYPSTNGNYPYDYWNIWVKNGQDLDAFASSNDVIIFKHCYPVSEIYADNGNPDISSAGQTIANYKLQYAALKAKMRQYPSKKFIVWTGAALNSGSTNPENAQRAKEFFGWVKNTWDEPGDNIFIWDFYNLETEGELYMKDAYASSAGDPHPNPTFSKKVAPYFGQRIIDVIEGRGDKGSVTGK